MCARFCGIVVYFQIVYDPIVWGECMGEVVGVPASREFG